MKWEGDTILFGIFKKFHIWYKNKIIQIQSILKNGIKTVSLFLHPKVLRENALLRDPFDLVSTVRFPTYNLAVNYGNGGCDGFTPKFP